jgi:hypothetical protein
MKRRGSVVFGISLSVARGVSITVKQEPAQQRVRAVSTFNRRMHDCTCNLFSD